MAERKSQVPPDLGDEVISDQETSTTPKEVLQISEHVDASPFSIPNEEYESSNPSAEFQTETSGTSTARIALTSVHRHARYYSMDHLNRGTCLVFNHAVFDSQQVLNRLGTGADVYRIETTFRNLGFNVVIRNDFEYNNIKDEIEKLSKADHTNNDCVCVFVLTHGDSGDRLWAKDVSYDVDRIWKPFTGNNCPTLAGKPKLFFFQACRGKQMDESVLVAQSNCSINDETDATAVRSYTIPTLADFLIARSSPFGWSSFRHVENGTWYVQSLCDMLDQFAGSIDLMRILTMASRLVAIEYQSYNEQDPHMHGRKQIPAVYSTLIRDVYFTSTPQ